MVDIGYNTDTNSVKYTPASVLGEANGKMYSDDGCDCPTHDLFCNFCVFTHSYNNGAHEPIIGEILTDPAGLGSAEVVSFTNTGDWTGSGIGEIVFVDFSGTNEQRFDTGTNLEDPDTNAVLRINSGARDLPLRYVKVTFAGIQDCACKFSQPCTPAVFCDFSFDQDLSGTHLLEQSDSEGSGPCTWISSGTPFDVTRTAWFFITGDPGTPCDRELSSVDSMVGSDITLIRVDSDNIRIIAEGTSATAQTYTVFDSEDSGVTSSTVARCVGNSSTINNALVCDDFVTAGFGGTVKIEAFVIPCP